VARVLMIARSTFVGDARVKRHAQALAERADQVDLICLDNPQVGQHGRVNVIGIRQQRYRGSSRSGYLRSYSRFFAAAALRALKLSLRHRYDVVIVVTMPDAAVLCALPCRLLGSKVVLDICDTMPELYRDKFGERRALGARVLKLQERISTWFAHRVLAVHDLHRERLVNAGVRGEKIRVVLNVPDPKVFAKPTSNGHARQSDFTVVFHGTIARRLGLDIAIRAIEIVQRRYRDVRLLVIGAGDYLAEAKELVSRLNLDSRVQFMAPMPVEELPRILCQAALGLVPNRASSATHLMLPVKLLEYAALGIPVVSARLRTIAHYFDENSVAFFEPDSPEDLACAIEGLRGNPQRRRALAENARQVLERINWDRQRPVYYEAIDSLFRSGRGEGRDDGRLEAL
jgi:glycosyltransferase involved in cell wall biosynthesis